MIPIDFFTIDTEHKGDFNNILQISNFKRNIISENEVPFICEVIEQLGSESIEIYVQDSKEIEDLSDALQNIKIHEKNQNLYSNRFKKEIDYISMNFFNIAKNQEEQLITLDKDTIERIIDNENLVLDSEDQLVDFINQLYFNNKEFSTFYEYVSFSNASIDCIKRFISIFNYDDLTNDVWSNITNRLEKEIVSSNYTIVKHKYKKEIPYQKNQEFKGIINYIRNEAKGYFPELVKVNSSSINGGKDIFSPLNSLLYEKDSNSFATNDINDSWIKFDFTKLKIILKNYTIKSYPFTKNDTHLKSWIIEGSNNNINWQILDEQKNSDVLNGKSYVHTFSVKNEKDKAFKYLRLKMTGLNHSNNNVLCFNSIEFYGGIILN